MATFKPSMIGTILFARVNKTTKISPKVKRKMHTIRFEWDAGLAKLFLFSNIRNGVFFSNQRSLLLSYNLLEF